MPDTLRALIYRPGSLGDTLVSLPAIAEIRRQYPDHRLTLLTEAPVADSPRVSPWTVLKETTWFDGVHFYVVRPTASIDRLRNVALALRLRRTGFDHIFSLAPPRTSRQLRVDACVFRGVIGSRGYHAARSPSWPPSVVSPEIEHEALRLLRIVAMDAGDQELESYRLPLPDAHRRESHQLLDALGVQPDQVLVGIAPGSARSTTTWPADRFAAVGNALLRQFRNVLLLAIGGSQERSLCAELCAEWGPRSHNLAGQLSVFGSASVLSRCATLIGNDSGSTHLAAVVGVPCVAIYSARNAPGQWTPLGRHHVILEHRPECAGCMLNDCVDEHNKCLTHIAVSQVYREAASVIESRAAWCLAN